MFLHLQFLHDIVSDGDSRHSTGWILALACSPDCSFLPNLLVNNTSEIEIFPHLFYSSSSFVLFSPSLPDYCYILLIVVSIQSICFNIRTPLTNHLHLLSRPWTYILSHRPESSTSDLSFNSTSKGELFTPSL